jgi:anti-sigma factor RsiW
MSDITHDEIRDYLPDLLHGNVSADRRRAVEDHLRGCAECAVEMRVLQMVQGAPSFAPMIDAVKVASAIPPYARVPLVAPRSRNRAWQMAVASAAVVLVAVTLVLRSSSAPATAVSPAGAVASAATQTVGVNVAEPTVSVPSGAASKTALHPSKRELQVATTLDGLSDGNVARLVSEIDALDGLPSTEPENLGLGDPTTNGEGGL